METVRAWCSRCGDTDDGAAVVRYLPHLRAYAVRLRGRMVGLVAFGNGRPPFRAVEFAEA